MKYIIPLISYLITGIVFALSGENGVVASTVGSSIYLLLVASILLNNYLPLDTMLMLSIVYLGDIFVILFLMEADYGMRLLSSLMIGLSFPLFGFLFDKFRGREE